MIDSPPVVLDSSDPLNLIIHNAAMDDNSDNTGNPPDWSQLSSLWPDQDSSTTKPPHFNDYIDFNMDMASNILDIDLDMSLNNSQAPGAIEPSALHLDRLGYPTYDDPFSFPASASPADILAAQFPFTFNPDTTMDSAAGAETPGMKQRRLSVTSSSSSSGPSFSPVPESIPSPGYLSPGNGYTSDSTQQSFSNSELSLDQSFGTDQAPAAGATEKQKTTTEPTPATTTTTTTQDISGDPAAELAQRVRQSAGVMLAVPMNSSTPFQPGQTFPSNILQTKLPIPRLQRPSVSSTIGTSPPKSGTTTPSATSSAASTPPPSTPPPNTTSNDPSATSTTAAPVGGATTIPATRPKTSHTTIERRYRTNLNARIQSLRMAVPALRVLEDRDSGSSKKIKKNLKGGVLIKSASSGTSTVIAVPGSPTPSNPYGEVDVIDERGYVDGVKVARKCSKANVLGKAVEYIRVLKRREMRLRAEQDGLKTLVCGLVGGPALLREWEREWKERFGGEERDEVADGEGDVEDEGDDDDDDDDVEEQEDVGKKRKRAKVEKDSGVAVNVKKEVKAATVTIGPDGQPEKRKRGRPRKVPLPPANSAPVASTEQQQQPQPQQQQQYLLAVFAMFSFFNSPLTSSSSHVHPHTHQGHVISPEISSQLTPPTTVVQNTATVTWRDWVQVAHLAITVLLFVSVVARMVNGFGFGRARRLAKAASSHANEDAEKTVEKIILGNAQVHSLMSALALYRSLPETASPIIKALFLYAVASAPSTSSLVKAMIKMRARSIWERAETFVTTKTESVVLSSPIDEVYSILSSIKPEEDEDLVGAIAAYIVKQKLGHALGKMFVREVTGSSASIANKEADNEQTEESLKLVIEAAQELGGEVNILAKNVERVRASSAVASVIGWSSSSPAASPLSDGSESGSEEDESDGSSLSASIDSEDEEDEREGGDVNPFMILRVLVLYRSLFSSASSSGTLLSSLSPPKPVISVEPPTPTTPTPGRRFGMGGVKREFERQDGGDVEQQKKMYVLRRLLGSRVFEKEEVEDARDRVVDMLVEAERRCVMRV